MLGHQLGAAGASEAIICALSLQQQVVPASINCVNQDPEIKLKLVKNNMQDHTYKYTVSNSFGFGGTNAAIVLAKI
jgi:3-oxoacyl-[acyl-carrier-protein] synthase II